MQYACNNKLKQVVKSCSSQRLRVFNGTNYNCTKTSWILDKTLINRIYNLDYEKLTVNQKSEIRQLIDYLDLDWDEKCLSPQNNTKSVKTASSVQIRKKVYRGSSEQWKKYQPFLNGALDGFIWY